MATPVSAAGSLNTDAANLQLVQAAATTANAASAASNNTQDTVALSAAAQQAAALAATPAPAPPPGYLQVLYLSEDGLTTNQIAAQLGITAQAVETYLGPPATPAPTTNTTA
ncbi:MAG: LuxR C-terminal-related transcriptional regulator [Candidatus Acidiferrales bacterium]